MNNLGHFQFNLCERVILSIIYFLYWLVELPKKALNYIKNKLKREKG